MSGHRDEAGVRLAEADARKRGRKPYTQLPRLLGAAALRLSFHTQFGVSGHLAEPKAETLEIFDQEGHCWYQPATFGVQQDPERPRQRDPENLGVCEAWRLARASSRITTGSVLSSARRLSDLGASTTKLAKG
jgi:hypothetical protein